MILHNKKDISEVYGIEKGVSLLIFIVSRNLAVVPTE
jgi:hypothetical protein